MRRAIPNAVGLHRNQLGNYILEHGTPFVEWLTRPPANIPRVFGNRRVALMGATPGRRGTLLAQAVWLRVKPYLRPRQSRKAYSNSDANRHDPVSLLHF
jgi:hypothetical protein